VVNTTLTRGPITTTHPKGSTSTSEWSLTFVQRNVTPANKILLDIAAAAAGVPPIPVGVYPGINGKLVAKADAANFTSGASAHTRTSWSDPLEFSLPANTPSLLAVLHGFANTPSTGDTTLAQSTGSASTETGQASIQRTFTGQIFDSSGALLSSQILEDVTIGTAADLLDVELGTGVSLLDGSTESSKELELLGALNSSVSSSVWQLPTGASISLGFAWSIPAAPFDRRIALGIDGLLSADEVAVPEPSSIALFGTAFAIGMTWIRRRRCREHSKD
jgi:hypothetical protein